MPYDPTNPNSTMGLSALSPTLSLENKYAAGMGKTAAQYLADKGNAALGMLALKKQYIDNVSELQKKMAQQPQAAPPTVNQQYDTAIAQQDEQNRQDMMQMMQQGKMAQGIGSMPAPTMERASFAGGGIVAFNDGGNVRHYDVGGPAGSPTASSWTDADEAELKKMQLLASATYGGFSDPTGGYAGPAASAGLLGAANRAASRFQELFDRKQRALAAQRDAASRIAEQQEAAKYGVTLPGASPAQAPAQTTAQVPSAAPAPSVGKKTAAPTAENKTAAPAAAKPAAYEDPQAAYIRGLEKDLKPEDKYIEEAIARNKNLGAGNAADEFEKVISKLKDRYEGEGADKANLKQSIVEFGAKLMAGKGGFNEALGAAAESGVSGFYGRKKENQKAAMDLAKSTFELHQAKENLKLSAAKEGSSEYDKQVKRIEEAKKKQLDNQVEFEKLARESQAAMARVTAQTRSQEKIYGDRSAGTAANLERQRLQTILTQTANTMKTAALSDPAAYADAKKKNDDAMQALQRLNMGGGSQGVMTLEDYLNSKGG